MASVVSVDAVGATSAVLASTGETSNALVSVVDDALSAGVSSACASFCAPNKRIAPTKIEAVPTVNLRIEYLF